MNSDTVLGGGQQDDAADFGEAQRGPDVQGGEDRLDGDDRWREFFDEAAEEGVNVLESRAGEFLLAFGFDAEGTVVHHFVPATVAFDNAVAGGSCGGGVDTEDAEAGICGMYRNHRMTVYGVREVAARGLSGVCRNEGGRAECWSEFTSGAVGPF